LTTSFPAFVPGEEAARRTVVTIEDNGYYLQEWRIIEHIGTLIPSPALLKTAVHVPPDPSA